MRRQAFAIGSLIALMVGSSPAVAENEPRHWLRQTDAPVVVTIYDHTGEAMWQSALQAAAAEWNAGITNIQFSYTIAVGDCEKGQGPLTVVVCVHANSKPNYVAETRWREEGGHLANMVIWMGPDSRAGRVHLSCHELGHALGLQHREEKGTASCMTNGTGRGKHPDQQDFQTATEAHAHEHP